MTGQRNRIVGRQHRGRGIAEKSQGKDREGGGPISLDNRKEGHQNLSYWDKVYWFAASASNGGTISLWQCCISDSGELPDNESGYGNLDRL